MELSAENIEKFFPYYLTEDRKKGLLTALRNISDRRYFARISDTEPLQGDGWSGLDVFRFEDGERSKVKGIVLTNSCDLSADNPRVAPIKLSFAPITPLDRYLNLLRSKGINSDRIAQHATDIRAQSISNFFYLPADPLTGCEFIAFLDDIHSIPRSALRESSEHKRIFSLSNVGFYLFVFKLSVHFCRLHEGIDRTSP